MIFLGWIIGEITGFDYILLNPITWTILTVELIAAMSVPDTVIANAKPALTGTFFVTLVSVLFVDLFFNQMPILWGILFVPLYITLGFIMMEAGKG